MDYQRTLLKKMLVHLLCIMALSASSACRKSPPLSDEEEETDTYPMEALAENDKSRFGIYRGVFRNKDGAGQMKLDLFNRGDDATLVVWYGNELDTLYPVHPVSSEEWADWMNHVRFTGDRFGAFVSINQTSFEPSIQLELLPEYRGEPVTGYRIFFSRVAKERSYEKVHALIGTFTPQAESGINFGTLDGLLLERTDPVNPRYHFRAMMIEVGAEHMQGIGASFQTSTYNRPENTPGTVVSLSFLPPVLTGTWELRQGSGTFEAKMIDWFSPPN